MDKVYFELIDEFEQTILDVHRNEDQILKISIGEKVLDFESIISALIEAKRRLNSNID